MLISHCQSYVYSVVSALEKRSACISYPSAVGRIKSAKRQHAGKSRGGGILTERVTKLQVFAHPVSQTTPLLYSCILSLPLIISFITVQFWFTPTASMDHIVNTAAAVSVQLVDKEEKLICFPHELLKAKNKKRGVTIRLTVTLTSPFQL